MTYPGDPAALDSGASERQRWSVAPHLLQVCDAYNLDTGEPVVLLKVWLFEGDEPGVVLHLHPETAEELASTLRRFASFISKLEPRPPG